MFPLEFGAHALKPKKQKINTGPPGKENMDKFASLCLSAGFVPHSFPSSCAGTHHSPTHRYENVYEKICMNTLFAFLNHAKHTIYPLFSLLSQVCSVRCCCQTLAMCGHCAGQSVAQPLCSPPCIITAVSVPARGNLSAIHLN